MIDYNWDQKYIGLFGKCLDLYREGNEDHNTYYTNEELAFLLSIGCSPVEFFDFVEDFVNHGEPSISTAVLIAGVRRDYFNVVMKGKMVEKKIETSSLPAKDAKIDNIEWFPRIISKARAKLRGEMSDDLMYCCGGDRAFLKHFDIHPADFLRLIWAVGSKDEQIINYLKSRAKALSIDLEYKIDK